MDINEIWKKIEKEKIKSPTLNKESIMKAISNESHSPLVELRKRLTYKMYWAIGFCLIIPLLMITLSKNTEMMVVFGILEIWYLFGLFYLGKKVNHLNKVAIKLDMASNLKKLIDVFYEQTRQVIKFEEWMGIMFFPIAVICGLLLPLFYKGMNLNEILGNSKILIVAIVSIIVIVPVGIWATKAMNEHAFKKYLEQLVYYKNRLEEL